MERTESSRGARAAARLAITLALAVALSALAAAAAPAAKGPSGPGDPSSIVNPDGGDALIPWQAALVQVENGSIAQPLEVFCGATVRDATHVITAAHCVPDSNASELAVVVGAVRRSDPGLTGAQAIAVSAITSHPLYGVALGNDLAVLTLARAITTPSARALPPVAVNASDVGRWALISGWGDTDPATPGGQQPDSLLYAQISVYPDAQCGGYGAGYAPATMLCAGYTSGGFTQDTCQGDSGGPLARWDAVNSAATALIGVVSFGRGCADPAYPGVYTRLANPDLNARAWAASPPPRLEPLAAPSVGGTPRVGETVQCAGDAWSDPAPQRDVSWLSAALDAQGRPTDVRGEGSGPALALGDALAGRMVTCDVRATNAGGARELQAAAVGPIAPRPAPQQPPVVQPPVVRPPRDIGAPSSAVTRRRCARRRCTLTVKGSDAASAVTRASVTVTRLTGCPRGRRGRACRAPRALRARALGGGLFTVASGRLPKARYRFTVTVVDAAGNRSRAVSVALAVR